MKYIGLLCAAFAIAACNKKTGNTVSETAGGGVAPAAAGTDTMGTSGTAAGSTATDTTMMRTSPESTGAAAGARSDSMKADTSRHDMTGASSSDTAQNQTQSGMTNAKQGKSTLGPKVKKTSPTSGAPVTSKGDTLRQGGDTTSHQ